MVMRVKRTFKLLICLITLQGGCKINIMGVKGGTGGGRKKFLHFTRIYFLPPVINPETAYEFYSYIFCKFLGFV